VVDLDLEKFSTEFNHDRLMGQIARRVHDKRLLPTDSELAQGGCVGERTHRTDGRRDAASGPLSPLLSNLVLDQLDRELERRGIGSLGTRTIATSMSAAVEQANA